MRMQNLMQAVLIVILLLCGYIYLFQVAAKRTTNKPALPLISLVLLVVYAVVMIPVMVIITQLGTTTYTLIAMMMLLACIVLFAAGYALVNNFRRIDKKMLVLFLLYLFVVGYITIYGRDGTSNDTSIRMEFAALRQALQTRSLEPLQHLWLNIVLFLPLGFFFPLMEPKTLNHVSYVIPIGLMVSTLIETIQMVLRIGQCDVEDILGNTLGAFLGILLYKVSSRIRRDEDW